MIEDAELMTVDVTVKLPMSGTDEATVVVQTVELSEVVVGAADSVEAMMVHVST